jgi:hypothetical protein
MGNTEAESVPSLFNCFFSTCEKMVVLARDDSAGEKAEHLGVSVALAGNNDRNRRGGQQFAADVNTSSPLLNI